jgi:hypothetical protein
MGWGRGTGNPSAAWTALPLLATQWRSVRDLGSVATSHSVPLLPHRHAIFPGPHGQGPEAVALAAVQQQEHRTQQKDAPLQRPRYLPPPGMTGSGHLPSIPHNPPVMCRTTLGVRQQQQVQQMHKVAAHGPTHTLPQNKAKANRLAKRICAESPVQVGPRVVWYITCEQLMVHGRGN